jgi:hypothetical protein
VFPETVGGAVFDGATVGSPCRAYPRPSSATHRLVEGHEIFSTEFVPSMFVGGLQLGEAAPGLVVITVLLESLATHSDVETHETLERPRVSISAGALHVGDGAVGSVVVSAFPTSLTTTHNDVEGQAILRGPLTSALLSIIVGVLHVGDNAVGSVVITA